MRKTKENFLKKVLATTVLASTFLSSFSIVNSVFSQDVYAESATVTNAINPKDVDPALEERLITAPGFFTKSFSVAVGNCQWHKQKAKEYKDANKDKVKESQGYNESVEDSFSKSDKSDGRETKAVNELMGSAADAMIAKEDSTDPDKGILGLGCAQFNFMQFLSRLIQPVNITQSSVIMSLVYNFQIVAIGVGVLLIAIFGLYYASGNETTDPVKFLIRGFFTLWLVFYLPSIAQDILNVNNMLVYWISTDEIKVASGTAVGSGVIIGMAAMTNTIISALATALYIGLPGFIFIGLLILVIIVSFILKQIFTMLFWWYARLLMIIFLVMLGPLFMIMMILPKTASYGQRWIKYFVGEVFTQTSMTIGMYFASYLLSNLAKLNAETNMGLFGNTLLVYGIYLLLARIPQISKSHIGGADIGGLNWGDAQAVGNTVGDFVKKAGFALVGQYARGKISERDLKEAEQVQSLEDQALNGATDNEKKLAREQLAKLEAKQALRSSLRANTERLADAYASGSWQKALGNIDDLRRKAEEKAKANNKQREQDIINEKKGYAKKLMDDASKGMEEVEKSIQKEKTREEARHAAAMDKIDRDEAEAIKRGKYGEKEKEEFAKRRASELQDHKSKMGEINAKDNEDYKNTQVRKLQDAYRENLEKIAAEIVGDGFETPMQKREAISRKADELEKAFRKEMEQDKQLENAKKAEEQLKSKNDMSSKANDFVQAMNSGVEALSQELQNQGLSKEEADARAAQMIQKSIELGNKENRIAELEKKKAQGKKKKLSEAEEKELQQLKEESNELKSEISSIGGAIGSKEVAEAIEKSEGAVADMLKNNGFNEDEAKKRAKAIVGKLSQISGLEAEKEKLLNTPMNELNEAEREEKLQALQQIANLKEDVANISGALTMGQVKEMLNNGHKGLSELLEQKGFEDASDRASKIIENSAEIDKMKGELAQFSGRKLTSAEQKEKERLEEGIEKLENENIALAGGITNGNMGKEALVAKFKNQGYNDETANKMADSIIEKQNKIDAINSANSDVLGDIKGLTNEQLERRNQAKADINNLKNEIADISMGGRSSNVSDMLNDAVAKELFNSFKAQGLTDEAAMNRTNALMPVISELSNLKEQHASLVNSDKPLTKKQEETKKNLETQMKKIEDNINAAGQLFTNEELLAVHGGGDEALASMLKANGKSEQNAKRITGNVSRNLEKLNNLKAELAKPNIDAATKDKLNNEIQQLEKDIQKDSGYTSEQLNAIKNGGAEAVSAMLEGKGVETSTANTQGKAIAQKLNNLETLRSNLDALNGTEMEKKNFLENQIKNLENDITSTGNPVTSDQMAIIHSGGDKALTTMLKANGHSEEKANEIVGKVNELNKLQTERANTDKTDTNKIKALDSQIQKLENGILQDSGFTSEQISALKNGGAEALSAMLESKGMETDKANAKGNEISNKLNSLDRERSQYQNNIKNLENDIAFLGSSITSDQMAKIHSGGDNALTTMLQANGHSEEKANEIAGKVNQLNELQAKLDNTPKKDTATRNQLTSQIQKLEDTIQKESGMTTEQLSSIKEGGVGAVSTVLESKGMKQADAVTKATDIANKLSNLDATKGNYEAQMKSLENEIASAGNGITSDQMAAIHGGGNNALTTILKANGHSEGKATEIAGKVNELNNLQAKLDNTPKADSDIRNQLSDQIQKLENSIQQESGMTSEQLSAIKEGGAGAVSAVLESKGMKQADVVTKATDIANKLTNLDTAKGNYEAQMKNLENDIASASNTMTSEQMNSIHSGGIDAVKTMLQANNNSEQNAAKIATDVDKKLDHMNNLKNQLNSATDTIKKDELNNQIQKLENEIQQTSGFTSEQISALKSGGAEAITTMLESKGLNKADATIKGTDVAQKLSNLDNVKGNYETQMKQLENDVISVGSGLTTEQLTSIHGGGNNALTEMMKANNKPEQNVASVEKKMSELSNLQQKLDSIPDSEIDKRDQLNKQIQQVESDIKQESGMSSAQIAAIKNGGVEAVAAVLEGKGIGKTEANTKGAEITDKLNAMAVEKGNYETQMKKLENDIASAGNTMTSTQLASIHGGGNDALTTMLQANNKPEQNVASVEKKMSELSNLQQKLDSIPVSETNKRDQLNKQIQQVESDIKQESGMSSAQIAAIKNGGAEAVTAMLEGKGVSKVDATLKGADVSKKLNELDTAKGNYETQMKQLETDINSAGNTMTSTQLASIHNGGNDALATMIQANGGLSSKEATQAAGKVNENLNKLSSLKDELGTVPSVDKQRRNELNDQIQDLEKDIKSTTGLTSGQVMALQNGGSNAIATVLENQGLTKAEAAERGGQISGKLTDMAVEKGNYEAQVKSLETDLTSAGNIMTSEQIAAIHGGGNDALATMMQVNNRTGQNVASVDAKLSELNTLKQQLDNLPEADTSARNQLNGQIQQLEASIQQESGMTSSQVTALKNGGAEAVATMLESQGVSKVDANTRGLEISDKLNNLSGEKASYEAQIKNLESDINATGNVLTTEQLAAVHSGGSDAIATMLQTVSGLSQQEATNVSGKVDSDLNRLTALKDERANVPNADTQRINDLNNQIQNLEQDIKSTTGFTSEEITAFKNGGAEAVSTMLQSQGVGKEAANTRGEEISRKLDNLDTLKSDYNLLDEKNTLGSQIATVEGQIKSLEGDINLAGSNLTSEQMAAIHSGGSNALTAMLQASGSSKQEAVQIAGKINADLDRLSSLKDEMGNSTNPTRIAELNNEIQNLESDIKSTTGLTSGQIASLKNGGSGAVSTMLESQGVEKSTANTKGTEMSQKLDSLDTLKNEYNALNNLEMERKDQKSSQISNLNNEIGSSGNVMNANQASSIHTTGTTSVAGNLGLDNSTVNRIAQKEQELASYIDGKKEFLGDTTGFTAPQHQQRAEAESRIEKLNDEITTLKGGMTSGQVGEILGNKNKESISSYMESQGFSVQEANARADAIFNIQNEKDDIYAKHSAVLGNVDTTNFTPEQHQARAEAQAQIKQLDSEINALVGGTSSQEINGILNGGANVLAAALEQQGNLTKAEALEAAAQIIPLQNRLDALQQSNNELLTTVGPLTQEQQSKKNSVLQEMSDLKTEIGTLGGGYTSEQISSVMNDPTEAIATILRGNGMDDASASDNANKIIAQYKKGNDLNNDNKHLLNTSLANLSEIESQKKEQILNDLDNIASELTSLSTGFTTEQMLNAAQSGFQEINNSLRNQGHSPAEIQARNANVTQLQNQIDTLRSSHDDLLSRSIMDLSESEIQDRQKILDDIAGFESQIVSQGGGLNYQNTGNILAPHMKNISEKSAQYNDALAHYENSLDSFVRNEDGTIPTMRDEDGNIVPIPQNSGEVVQQAAANAIATSIISNGGAQEAIQSATGSNSQAYTQYLANMGAGNSAVGIVEDLRSLGDIQTMVEQYGTSDNVQAFHNLLNSGESSITMETISGINSEVKKDLNELNSSTGGGVTQSSVIDNYVNAARETINPSQASEQVVEGFGRAIGESVWSNYVQNGPSSTKFLTASNSLSGSAIGLINEAADETIHDFEISNMFEQAGFADPMGTTTELLNHAPEIQGVVAETIQTGNMSKDDFDVSFDQATVGMNATLAEGIKTALWKEVSASHPMESRTGYAFEVGGTAYETVSGLTSGTVEDKEIATTALVNALGNNSVPNPREVGEAIVGKAPELQAKMDTFFQMDEPTKSAFVEQVTPLLANVEAPVAEAIVETMWSGLAHDTNMKTSVPERRANAIVSLGDSPMAIVEALSDGHVTTQDVAKTFDELAVPNPEREARILVQSASGINNIVSDMKETGNTSKNEFETRFAQATSGMDTVHAEAFKVEAWKEISASQPMEARTSHAFEVGGTPYETVTGLTSGTVESRESATNALVTSLENNSVPNATVVGRAIADNAPQLQATMHSFFQMDEPTKSAFVEQMQPLLENVDSSVGEAIIDTMWSGMAHDTNMNTTVPQRISQAVNILGNSPVKVFQEIGDGIANHSIVMDAFEETAVPNPGDLSHVLVSAAPEVNDIVTLTMNSESANADIFREDVADIIVANGGDRNTASHIADTLWTDTAKNLSMDNRFENTWSSPAAIVEQLNTVPEAEADTIVTTIVESMERNAIPNAKETAGVIRENVQEIHEIIETATSVENPTVNTIETAQTELTKVLGGITDKNAKKSLIKSLINDIEKTLTGEGKPIRKSNPQKDEENQ